MRILSKYAISAYEAGCESPPVTNHGVRQRQVGTESVPSTRVGKRRPSQSDEAARLTSDITSITL